MAKTVAELLALLRVYKPVIVHNLLTSIELVADASRSF